MSYKLQNFIVQIAHSILIISAITAFTSPIFSKADDFSYDVIGTNVTIYAYYGRGGTVVIPSKVEGLGTVTAIAANTFVSRGDITSITFPDNLLSIGTSAFSCCTSLTNIYIPDSVNDIESAAFLNCSNLINIHIPASISILQNVVFFGTAVTNIVIPENVTNIQSAAFGNCMNLTNATIPKSVLSASDGVFAGCANLESIEVDAANPIYSSVEGVRFNKEKTVLCEYPMGRSATFYQLPEGVTTIGSNSFGDNTFLKSVSLPNSLTNIEDGAFFSCVSLTNIIIPDSVTQIGNEAFWGCSNLTKINIPTKLSILSRDVFVDCGFSSIVIPDSVKKIDQESFAYCANLTNITIPKEVTNIVAGAFKYCGNLKSIDVNTNNSVYSSINGTLFNKNGDLLLICPGGFIGEYIIPDGVTNLSSQSFYQCGGITKITFPASITALGNVSIDYCANLVNAYFLGDAPTLGSSTLANLNANFTISYPATAKGWSTPTWHGLPAFPYSTTSGQLVVTLEPAVAASNGAQWNVDGGAWHNSGDSIAGLSTGSHIVFFKSVDAWSAPVSQSFTITNADTPTIITGVFIGREFWYSVNGTNVTITGYSGDASVISFPTSIAGVGTVTAIGNNAFAGKTNLTKVIIPSCITTVGDNAFTGCSNLIAVYFEGNAPATFGSSVFDQTASGFTIYYTATSTGWTTSTWNGYSARIYLPKEQWPILHFTPGKAAFTLLLNQLQVGGQYQLQTSTNLLDWYDDDSVITATNTSQVHSRSFSETNVFLFFRLKANQ